MRSLGSTLSLKTLQHLSVTLHVSKASGSSSCGSGSSDAACLSGSSSSTSGSGYVRWAMRGGAR